MLNLKFDEDIFLNKEEISPARARSIRKLYNMTQENFANLIGIKYVTLRSWEQGVRKPSSAAIALLKIVEKYPEIFLAKRKEIINAIMQYFKN